MKKISLFDISTEKEIKNKFLDGLEDLIEKNQWIMGKDVIDFENSFAEYLKVKKAASVNSGTDALELSLRGLGIGVNDKVIVPALSFFATSEAVLKVGAIPIYSDVYINDLNIDINSIKNLVDEKTKAIIPVHLFGNPANMSEIKEFATDSEIVIIEDVAQAFGSNFEEAPLGSIGDVGCFSFYPTKNLGAYGDGGCVVTNNQELYEKILTLRNHGQTKKYYHEYIGYNSRLDTIQAKILNIKLTNINNELNTRKKISSEYFQKLSDNKSIKVHTTGDFPLNLFPVSFINKKILNKVKNNLEKNNVEFGIYYPYGLHQFPISKHTGRKLKNVEWATENVITLPNHPNLTNDEINFISNLINSST